MLPLQFPQRGTSPLSFPLLVNKRPYISPKQEVSTTLNASSYSEFFSNPVLLVSRFDPVLELHQYELKTAFSNTERYAIEYLKGMDAVNENDRQHFFAGRLMDVFHAYQNTTFTFGGLTNRLAIFAELGGLTALLLIMGTSAVQVINNGLSPGTFVAIMSVCGALLPAILRLNGTRINLRAASVSFSRMYEMLSLGDNKPNDDEAVLDPFVFRSLEANNVSFRFPGRSPVLGEVNLEVRAGELTLLTGSNGAGKTTLLLLLQKFYLPTSGIITMNGIPLEQVPDFRLRNTIAYVPQDVKLFPLTVCQNIVFGQEISAEQFDRFCQTYGFNKFFNRLPHGLFTMIGENGVKLSGGQRQMVGLARALLRSPELLLLDEPTASMDLEAERKVIDLLIKLKSEGLAIVMVTHRIHLLNRYADRLYMM